MEAPAMIDFLSDATHVLLNPRLDAATRERLTRLAEGVGLVGHVWIATSGTTGSMRLVALSKEAIRASAAAVNRRFSVTPEDVWCCVLPTFHVGGLGIYARASLSGSRVVSMDWRADEFVRIAEAEGVSLVSLVPAQVFDLIERKFECPPGVRAVVVGGGAMRDADRERARELGWPVLPSYGMTETASQIATAESVDDPSLRLLDHAECRTDEDGRLMVRAASLLTGWVRDAEEAAFETPLVDGWYATEDRGAVRGRVIEVRGRGADFVKIGGESVDLTRLDALLAEVSRRSMVVDVPDARLGCVIHLLTEEDDPAAVAAAFDARVLPFERARGAWRTARLPQTELGKRSRAAARSQVKKILGMVE